MPVNTVWPDLHDYVKRMAAFRQMPDCFMTLPRSKYIFKATALCATKMGIRPHCAGLAKRCAVSNRKTVLLIRRAGA